jgi:hypothetical protein
MWIGMHVAQERDQWWARMNTVTNLAFYKKRVISWRTEWLLASQEGLCSMELARLDLRKIWHLKSRRCRDILQWSAKHRERKALV